MMERSAKDPAKQVEAAHSSSFDVGSREKSRANTSPGASRSVPPPNPERRAAVARAELNALPPQSDEGAPEQMGAPSPQVRPEESRKADVAAIAETIVVGVAFALSKRFPSVIGRLLGLRSHLPHAFAEVAQGVTEAGMLPVHGWLYWAGLAARGLRFVERIALDEIQVRLAGGPSPAPIPNAPPETA